MITSGELSSLRRLVMSLYTLPFSNEFRQPIQILHPELLESYMFAIPKPIDLGTILLKLQNEEYHSVMECREDIKLVFSNAICFNSELSNLVAMANHLTWFSRNLWHEIMSTPFDDKEEETFTETINTERVLRYQTCRLENLSSHDIISFREFLGSIHCENSFMKSLIDDISATCFDDSLSATHTIHSLTSSIISSLFSKAMKENNTQITELSYDLPLFIACEISHDAEYCANSDAIRWYTQKNGYLHSTLTSIDNYLHEFTAHISERRMRGYDLSAVWARPSDVVWVQPNKSPWWPAILIAGSNVPPQLSNSNFSRVPNSILDALAKLRPKTVEIDPVTKNRLFIGTNVCLVEYFGTHDFGWAKPELCIPFSPSGKLIIPPNKKGLVSSEKVTSDMNAMNEAVHMSELLQGTIIDPPYDPPFDFLDTLEEQIIEFSLKFNSSKIANNKSNEMDKSTVTNDTTASKSSSKGKLNSNPKVKAKEGTTATTAKERGVDKTDNYSINVNVNSDTMGSKYKKKTAILKTKHLATWLQQCSPIVPSTANRGRPYPGTSLNATLECFRNSANRSLNDDRNNFSGKKSGKDDKPMKTEGVDLKENIFASDNILKSDSKVPNEGISNKIAGVDGRKRYRPFTGNLVNLYCTSEVTPVNGVSAGGVLHSRKVNFQSPIFFKENKSIEKRKLLLQEEISKLDASISQIVSITGINPQEENRPASRIIANKRDPNSVNEQKSATKSTSQNVEKSKKAAASMSMLNKLNR